MQISSISTSSEFASFVLSNLRVAHIKARLIQSEIDFVGTALHGGLLDGETALSHLSDGAMSLFPQLTRRSS